MEVNTLVKHKKLKSLGIGCISKVLKNQVAVNWGTEDNSKHKESVLEIVDTSKCKTMPFHKWRNKNICNSWPSGQVRMIIGNEVKEYVGIGWISQGVVTEADLKKYTRVID